VVLAGSLFHNVYIRAVLPAGQQSSDPGFDQRVLQFSVSVHAIKDCHAGVTGGHACSDAVSSPVDQTSDPAVVELVRDADDPALPISAGCD